MPITEDMGGLLRGRSHTSARPDAIVKQECRYDSASRSHLAPGDDDSRSSGCSSSWLSTKSRQKHRQRKAVHPRRSMTEKPGWSSRRSLVWFPNKSDDEDSASTEATRRTPFEDILVQSLSSIALSARIEQLDRLVESSRSLNARSGDQFRKPVHHHEDLLPLTELALLMSTELTIAKGKGLFGPLGQTLEIAKER